MEKVKNIDALKKISMQAKKIKDFYILLIDVKNVDSVIKHFSSEPKKKQYDKHFFNQAKY